MSFLMLDVDHFKKINDQYGHLVGDQVLSRIGTIVRENIREIDIAGRFGGEEFGIVLPETNMGGACFVAERLRAAVENVTIAAYDTKLKVTISLGVSNFPLNGQDVEELIEKADLALYKAKKNGRNKVCSF